MKKILVCEDSFEGIMSGIYDAWVILNKVGSDNVGLSCFEPEELNFFVEYEPVERKQEHALKVADSIRRKISDKVYIDIYRTAISASPDKADLIFRYLQHGYKKGRRISECLAIPEVMEVTRLSKRVQREYDHIRGFLRFNESVSGILSSEIEPENDIIELLGNHFSDRLPSENFLITDVGRQKTLVHEKYNEYYVVDGEMSEYIKKILRKEIQPDTPKKMSERLMETEQTKRFLEKGIYSENMRSISIGDENFLKDNSERERKIEELWQVFFDTIAIDTRRNDSLQKNNLPLRFRKYMTEFERKDI